jgi:hypothetical protein
MDLAVELMLLPKFALLVTLFLKLLFTYHSNSGTAATPVLPFL